MMLLALLALLLLSLCLSVGTGAIPIAPQDVVLILTDPHGLTLGSVGQSEAAVLFSIRLPRAIVGGLVGGGLAIAGAALQGLFRNPLADPALVGVSTGAAVAAVLTIVLGGALVGRLGPTLAPLALPAGAFVGGLLTTLLIQRIATRDGQVQIATMLLAGIAINALAGALVGAMTFISDDQQLRELTFWLMGSLASSTWQTLVPAIPFLALPLVLLPRFWRPLNALLLGEIEAHYLGFDVDRAKRHLILLVALGTGAAVAVSGVIGFIGLVTPHLVRLTIGPDHRYLLPGSALLGASLLLLAEIAARTLVLPAELPIGIVTACFGAPFFLWLLARHRDGHGLF
jgi:iron complex transport system permease protein